MILSVLDRLEEIQKKEGLNKSEFERIIEKSSGYIGILRKKGAMPGSDVLIKVSEKFRNYDLNWLLTGEGAMLKNEGEPAAGVQDPNEEYENATLQSVREDLQALAQGVNKNFEVLSDAMIESLKGQQKILKFIDQLDAKKISESTSKLDRVLKELK